MIEREEKAQKALFSLLNSKFDEITKELNTQRAMLSDVREMVNQNNALLKNLMKGESDCPSLFYIYTHAKSEKDEKPTVKGKGLKAKVERAKGLAAGLKGVFKETCMLVIVCPFTHKAVKCGPQGTGFKIERPSATLKKWAPAIKTGLLVLKVACLAGKCLGLPLPVMPKCPGLDESADSQMVGFSEGEKAGTKEEGMSDEQKDSQTTFLDGLSQAISALCDSEEGDAVAKDGGDDDEEEEDGDKVKEARDELDNSMDTLTKDSDLSKVGQNKNIKAATGPAFRRLQTFLKGRDPKFQMLGVEKTLFMDECQWIDPHAALEWKSSIVRDRIDALRKKGPDFKIGLSDSGGALPKEIEDEPELVQCHDKYVSELTGGGGAPSQQRLVLHVRVVGGRFTARSKGCRPTCEVLWRNDARSTGFSDATLSPGETRNGFAMAPVSFDAEAVAERQPLAAETLGVTVFHSKGTARKGPVGFATIALADVPTVPTEADAPPPFVFQLQRCAGMEERDFPEKVVGKDGKKDVAWDRTDFGELQVAVWLQPAEAEAGGS